jgi:probable rRNA maturation factor
MIEILNQQNKHRVNPKVFEELLEKLVAHYQLDNPEITLVFVDNAAIKKLNKDFLNKDEPTDVLSFPLREKGADGHYYLGDIIISVPYASLQSESQKHSLERELEMLTIHGFLHLLEFEHMEGMEEEEKKIHQWIFKEKNGN